MKYAGYGSLTKEGLKPKIHAWLSPEKDANEIIEKIKEYLELDSRALYDNAKLRQMLKDETLNLLGQINITTHGVREGSEDAQQKAEELRAIIRKRIENFLTSLKLGEGNSVCIVDCKSGEEKLTYENEPNARIMAPLLHFLARDVPENNVLRFLTFTILFDGHVKQDQVLLTIGHTHVMKKEKQLPIDIYDKVALYLILAAKYGVEVKGIYFTKKAAMIYFDIGYAKKMFTATWDDLSELLRWGKELGIRDRIYKKVEKMSTYVDDLVKRIKIDYTIHKMSGVDPWVEVKFRACDGVISMAVWWDGRELRGTYRGTREEAERLASILSELGVETKIKPCGRSWCVELTTSHILAIRHPQWQEAVNALVDELYKQHTES